MKVCRLSWLIVFLVSYATHGLELNTLNQPQDYLSPFLEPNYGCDKASFSSVQNLLSESDELYRQCIVEICSEDAPSMFSVGEQYDQQQREALKDLKNNQLKNMVRETINGAKKVAIESLESLSESEREEIKNTLILNRMTLIYARERVRVMNELAQKSSDDLLILNDSKEMAEVFGESLARDLDAYSTLGGNALFTAGSELQALSPTELAQKVERTNLLETLWSLPKEFDAEKMSILFRLNSLENRIDLKENQHLNSTNFNTKISLYRELKVLQARAKEIETYKVLGRNILKNPGLADLKELKEFKELSLKEMIASDESQNQDLCVENIVSQLAKLPGPLELDAAHKRISQAKETIIKRIDAKELYSRHSRRKLKTLIRGLKVKLPPGQSDYLQEIANMFSTATRMHSRISPRHQIFSAAGSGLSQACFMNRVHDEGMYFSHGHAHNHDFVYLSNSAVQDMEKVGVPIFAHEVGHVVSIFFKNRGGSFSSRQHHREALRCLNRGHVNGSFFEKLFTSGPDIFREEDYADSFSSQVMGDMTNLGCTMMKDGLPSTHNKGVLTTSSSIYPNPNWQHSSTVYRLLHWQKSAGRDIPSSCQRSMQIEGANINLPNSCVKTYRPDNN